MTKIYSIVKQYLDDYISNQSEIITNINKSLSKYNNIYDEEIKLDLLEKINKIMKESSKNLIHQYLTNSFKNESEKFFHKKSTDLSALSSLRLNYSTNVDNTILYYGYNFVVDEDNYKVYLNISANTSVDVLITYQSEYLSTDIAGSIGKGMIGLNLEMDFFNENVKAIYKSEFGNNTVKKELYENRTNPNWDNCTDDIECFEKCPRSYTIENGVEKQLTTNENDLEYYKNSSIYEFKGLTENKLCSYSKYLLNVTDVIYSFNSSLERTV
jgi:hypothetical protein